MARPRRPVAEIDAVVQAAAKLAPSQSARVQAKTVARAVVAELIADVERVDPFDRAMFDARQAMTRDPVVSIVSSDEIDLAGMVHKERIKRFEARGCIQIEPKAWACETAEIAELLTARLESRYRHFFSDLAVNRISGHLGDASLCK
ncbi:MAG: hypothetical protein C0429_17340 [Sphingopyxis sp.]|nr:hypothetical protein [Sphingopyxis sp.]